jgi:Mrp family chromosome partitioning ATPase
MLIWTVSVDGPRPAASSPAKIKLGVPDAADGPEFDFNGSAGPAEGLLSLLPSGGAVPTSRSAQHSRLGPLLRELHSRADLVILDTPPALLTVEMTELAQLIDLVLVVVRQGRVSQRSLRSLGRHARAWPAELLGAVLTDVPAVGGEHGRYYGGR